MTDGARELTAGATPPRRPASELRVFGAALAGLGFDVAALLARAGLTRTDLDDPDATVPCTALDVVIGGALAQRRVPNLAAHMAFHTPIGAFPLLDYLVLTADTVGDALRQLQRYFHLIQSCRLEIADEADAVRLLVQSGTEPFFTQYTTAVAVHHLRDETAGRVSVTCVTLAREPDDRRDLERLLGCPVRAPAAWSGVEFPRATMRVPLRRRDPVLRAVLEGRAGGAPSPAPERGRDSTVALVRTALAARVGVGVGLPDIDAMARRLAMAPRTLQRRLAAEGVSYKELMDLARRDAAERLLADRSLAVAEVGYLIGFSEPSAFHRAFKRWLGITPLEYRAASRSP